MRAFVALALLTLALDARAGLPLPSVVAGEFPVLALRGEHRLRFLLLHVYDVSLWISGPAWSQDELFALDIRYAMEIRGKDLSARSVAEMRKQGLRDAPALDRWEAEMNRVFPDIKPGARLVGVNVPGREARFYDERGLIGTIPDPRFARAFFAIWLGERSSEPGMRRRLLGLAE